MSKILKRKYRNCRKEFRMELYEKAKENKALAMLIIKTYTSYQHNKHITLVGELLGHHHKIAYKDYCDKLMGKHITGRDDIFHSLYFAEQSLYEKYSRRIPQVYAMGDALGVACKVLKENKRT